MEPKDIKVWNSYVETSDGVSLTVRTVESITNNVVRWRGQTAFWNIQTGTIDTYTHSGLVHIDYFARDVQSKL